MITHITPREAELQREIEQLNEKIIRQSQTIYAHEVTFQSLQAHNKLTDELLCVLEEQAKDEYSCETAIQYMNMYVVEYIAEMPK